MIATQHERKVIALHGGRHGTSYTPSHWKNAAKILKSWISDLACFENRHFDVAFIFQGVSQLAQFLMKMCITDRTRTHIHAAAICTEVNGYTDNIYLHKTSKMF